MLRHGDLLAIDSADVNNEDGYEPGNVAATIQSVSYKYIC